MSKKRVLFITHGLPPFSYGGVEVYASHLYSEFQKSETFSPLILARVSQGKYWDGLIYSDSVDSSKFYIQTSTSDLFHLVNKQLDDSFKDFLLNVKPDVVHFQHYLHLSTSWLELTKKVLPESTQFLTLHEYIGLCPNSGQMIKTLRMDSKLCHKSSVADCSKCFPHIPVSLLTQREKDVKHYFSYIDAFISPSEFLKSRYVAKGFDPEKIHVIENGLPETYLKWPREVIKNNKKKIKLLYIGQINHHKGLHVLVNAMKLIDSAVVELNIYGRFQDSNYEAKIKKEISVRNNIFFHGSYTQNNLREILDDSDMLVVPSIWWENSPLVIQEAFAAKIPVLCSNIGGMKEKVLDGVNGVHFICNNPADLARKIDLIASQPALIKSLSSKSPRITTVKQNRLEFEKMYQSKFPK